jgi:branched-chain amino acid transport system substrate-binding protein
MRSRFVPRRAVLLAAALASLAPQLASRAASAETLRLGAILPLTGPGGVIGTEEQRGIQFATERANAAGGVAGQQIEVVFEDNQAKPDQSVLSLNKLVDLQHLPVIFTGYSGPTLAMAPLATRKKVLLVNAAAQADKLAGASPFLINTIPVIGAEVDLLAKYLAAQGKTNAAILFENNAAGIAGRDDFLASFGKAGGKVVAQEPVAFGETNYRPALLKLAAAQPDVMFVVLTSGVSQLADQAKQLDVKFLVTGTTFFADPIALANPNATGWLHTQVRIDAPPDLAEQFRTRFGGEMSFFARQYYNAANVVFAAITDVIKGGHEVTGESVRDAILRIGHFEGLVPVTFKTNTASAEIDIDRFEGGRDVVVQRMQSE